MATTRGYSITVGKIKGANRALNSPPRTPPSDIHSFEALTDDTYALTIVGGEYSPLRHYYNLKNNTYAVRTPKALKESGALA